MRLFSKKPAQPTDTYRPIPSNARTIEEWQQWEAERGCVTCEQKGCHRMNHSYGLCVDCNSPYCNGDACPGVSATSPGITFTITVG